MRFFGEFQRFGGNLFHTFLTGHLSKKCEIFMSKIFKFYFLNFLKFLHEQDLKLCFPIFHVLGKIFDFVLAKKRHFCGSKFEISNPSVENFDMNIQNPSVVQCTILISTL